MTETMSVVTYVPRANVALMTTSAQRLTQGFSPLTERISGSCSRYFCSQRPLTCFLYIILALAFPVVSMSEHTEQEPVWIEVGEN